MVEKIKQEIIQLLHNVDLLKDADIVLTQPPKSEMGDFAFPCFDIAKKVGKNPAEVAVEISENFKFQISNFKLIERIEAFGPYVNFFLNKKVLAEMVMKGIAEAGEKYGTHDLGKNKQILVEFACPNPMKVFHLGHLRNLITGEAVVRMFENAGYDVKRVNYQGDVGMHIAKTLWGIDQLTDEFEEVKNKTVKEKVVFLGKAYALGATKFEEDETAKDEILAFNKKVYERDPSIHEMYTLGREWSLEYFDSIYKTLNSHFDRLYFESEVFDIGLELVQEGLKKGIFKESDGAIIFEGSKYDLHDRVFVNSKGLPTYEGKELGLAKLHFMEFNPDQVIHVVGKEQTEYFKVLFKALEKIMPETTGKEYHLVGGYLQLKGAQKMSSRTGNVIAGDELLFAVESCVADIMKESKVRDKEKVSRAVTVASLKYAMLKSNVSQDMAFDMEESISTSGDSGPYLLYIVARIKSILGKAGDVAQDIIVPEEIHDAEKNVLLALAEFPEVTYTAVEHYDPSRIAKYLFTLAQLFNNFYTACPVLTADDETKHFRLMLIQSVADVMTRGLDILGIDAVEEM